MEGKWVLDSEHCGGIGLGKQRKGWLWISRFGQKGKIVVISIQLCFLWKVGALHICWKGRGRRRSWSLGESGEGKISLVDSP